MDCGKDKQRRTPEQANGSEQQENQRRKYNEQLQMEERDPGLRQEEVRRKMEREKEWKNVYGEEELLLAKQHKLETTMRDLVIQQKPKEWGKKMPRPRIESDCAKRKRQKEEKTRRVREHDEELFMACCHYLPSKTQNRSRRDV